MLKRIYKVAALLGLVGIASVSANADAITFVDTIGDGSKYQIGKQITRFAEVGFESYPASGVLTGRRPAFNNPLAGWTDPDHNASTEMPQTTCKKGTSGVPISSANSAWVAQPFQATQSGKITKVTLIAQRGKTVGYTTQHSGDDWIRIKIIPWSGSISAPPTSWDLPAQPDWNDWWINLPAGMCQMVSKSNESNGFDVTAGQNYLLLIGVGVPGQAWPGNNRHALLNWVWHSVAPNNSNVCTAYQSINNAAKYFTLQGRVIAVKLEGTGGQKPVDASIADIRNMEDGAYVRVTGVKLAGKTGGVGPNFVYVEYPGRFAGIRANATTSASMTDILTVTGTVQTLPSGEKILDQASIQVSGSSQETIAPVCLNTRALGSNYGLNSTGLLVHIGGVIGNVTSNSFTISDGYNDGIKCEAPGLTSGLSNGQLRSVIGVVAIDSDGTPKILVRQASDISPSY